MSVRFHRSTPLLTLFHDPKSASSRRLLAQLQRKLSTPDSAASSVGDAAAYLRLAASDSTGAPLAELEVRDRHKAPPTEQQWKTIRSYLPAKVAAPSSVSQSLREKRDEKQEGEEKRSVGEAAAEFYAVASSSSKEASTQAASSSEDTRQPTAKEDAEAEQEAAADETVHLPVRLRPGPILIAWEAGRVATDEASALRLIEEIEKGDVLGQQGKWGCVVC